MKKKVVLLLTLIVVVVITGANFYRDNIVPKYYLHAIPNIIEPHKYLFYKDASSSREYLYSEDNVQNNKYDYGKMSQIYSPFTELLNSSIVSAGRYATDYLLEFYNRNIYSKEGIESQRDQEVRLFTQVKNDYCVAMIVGSKEYEEIDGRIIPKEITFRLYIEDGTIALLCDGNDKPIAQINLNPHMYKAFYENIRFAHFYGTCECDEDYWFD